MPTQQTAPTDRLTVAQAAEHLHCSKTTVKRYIHSGKLPATRIGRPFLIRRSDLDALEKPVPVDEVQRTDAIAAEIAANAPALSPASRARLADLLR